ncbi:MAG TPA: class I SAM-dependent methyltransferase [Solirubrobacteraceae bacterium]|jgi:2-polyprenyl-3-methyl-5-hydroxy-6-metoxy-1,4-benzoquinol methylase
MSATDYADTYDPDTDFDRHYTLATADRIRQRLAPGSRVLELGCAAGLMTSAIADGTVTVLGIDRSEDYLQRARARELPGSCFVLGDLDALEDSPERFDHILATNVLHELRDPLAFLSACGKRLSPSGLVHVTLQNPLSIHRLCALELGLIESLTEISQRGAQWGTRGLWSAQELQALAAEAGLQTVTCEGIMLKPLPNAQMAELSEEILEGFARAARHLPGHCAMNYLVLADG